MTMAEIWLNRIGRISCFVPQSAAGLSAQIAPLVGNGADGGGRRSRL
jgi:hypothetical protein